MRSVAELDVRARARDVLEREVNEPGTAVAPGAPAQPSRVHQTPSSLKSSCEQIFWGQRYKCPHSSDRTVGRQSPVWAVQTRGLSDVPPAGPGSDAGFVEKPLTPS